MRLHGTVTYLNGTITGVHHLYIEDGAFVSVANTANTALLINKTTYGTITSQGNISFPSLNIRKDAVLELQKIQGNMIIDTAIFEAKYKGTVLMNHGFITAEFMDVESEAIINLKGRGESAGSGPGRGSGSNGGSFGGYGGSSSVGGAATPYGSMFTPKQYGSGGGNGGGAGGGFLEIDIIDVFHVDGVITVAGDNAPSGTWMRYLCLVRT